MNRIKRVFAAILLLTLGYLVYYCWKAFPVLTGYSAKMACSCMYLGERTLQSVEEQELGRFPLKLASVEVLSDSSVVATVMGLAKQTAVFRPGLGCTLVNEISKEELKNQVWQLPELPKLNPDTISWPMGDRLPDSTIASFSPGKLEEALNFAFANQKKRSRFVPVR